jgi:hypothetical protein
VMPISGIFTGTRRDCTSLDVHVRTEELPP